MRGMSNKNLVFGKNSLPRDAENVQCIGVSRNRVCARSRSRHDLFLASPIPFAPNSWARPMRWPIPEDPRSALRFGRCLGAFVVVPELFIFRAKLAGVGLAFVFEFMTLFWIFMIVIHIVGAAQRAQPISESLEIGFLALPMTLAAAFMPVTRRAKTANCAESRR